MDLSSLTLRDHPGGRVVGQEPVGRELSGEGERLGLALVEEPGARPSQGLLMSEELGLDRRRDVDSAGTSEKRERFGLEEMKQRARVADDPDQRSASLRPMAQRMSSR